MKKSISTCLLLLFISLLSISYAQKRVTAPSDRSTTQDFRKVQFGLGLGVNVSSISADWEEYFTDGDEVGPLGGFNLGVYLKIQPSKVFAFQPGFQFSSRGYTVGDDVDVRLYYLNIPIQFKFYVYQGLNIEVGPTIGFLTSADFIQKDEDPVNFMEEDAFLPLDIALGFGVGYHFKFGLVAALHYDIGLLNINNYFLEIWYDEFDRLDFPMKNSVTQLNVTYFF